MRKCGVCHYVFFGLSRSESGAPAFEGRLFTKKWKILIFLGPHSHPILTIKAKFCTAKRTHVPVGPAKFDLNRCNESPLRGEKPDFWLVSKFNTGSLPLRGILPVIKSADAALQFALCYCRQISCQLRDIPYFRPRLLLRGRMSQGRKISCISVRR